MGKKSLSAEDAEIAVQDAELRGIFNAYLDGLAIIIPAIMEWWDGLCSIRAADDLAAAWPTGPCPHPAVIGIYRNYYIEAERVYCRRQAVDAPAISWFEDTAWGSEDPPTADPDPVHPAEILIEWTFHESAELHELMAGLIMPPIGEPPIPTPTLDTLATFAPLAHPPDFQPPLLHDTQRGLVRLLTAPSDLRDTPLRLRTRFEAPTHEPLFRAYEHQLAQALDEGVGWWQGLLTRRAERGLAPAQALEDAYAFTVAGPAGHGRVLGVLQTYWALCEQLNAALPPEHRVAPEQLLLDWLRDGKHDSWVTILAGLPYWPVGLDAEGNWF